MSPDLRFRTLLAEALKFAAAIFVFVGFDALAPDADTLGWEAVKTVAVALIAGLSTFLVLDVALGVTRIYASWEIDDVDAPDRKSALVLAAGNSASLRVRLVGLQLGLPFRIYYRFKQPDLNIEIKFRPAKTLSYIKQRPSSGAWFDSNVLKIDLQDGLYVGELAWSEISATRNDSSQSGNDVSLTARLTTTSRPAQVFLWLTVRVDCGLDVLKLGSA